MTMRHHHLFRISLALAFAAVLCGTNAAFAAPRHDDARAIAQAAAPAPAAPASDTTVQQRTLTPPAGMAGLTLQGVIGRFTRILVGVSGSIALLMFVWGGFLWLTSGGSEQRVAKGKKIFVWSAIGLFVIFGAYAMLALLFRIFGIQT